VVAVRTLQGLGARRVMVVGSPDLAALPWARGRNLQSAGHGPVFFLEESRRFRDRVNGRLAAELPALGAQLRMQIAYFDLAAAGAAIRAAAQRNGLRNFTDPCQPGGASGSFAPACADPDVYWFWDEYHPTRRAGELIAAEMAKALRSPSSSKVLP
jgi:phospholipase/lecithinase/hemolysin